MDRFNEKQKQKKKEKKKETEIKRQWLAPVAENSENKNISFPESENK